VLLFLLDAKNPAAKAASVAALTRLGQFNRRTLVRPTVARLYTLASSSSSRPGIT
jgi:hypothetical protein